ncbi:MAG: hypothetical protein IT209_12480 [Armatimonadetes bacterium]|nr:hypothetical protein [Armatimonadota bacterium]
MRLTLIVVWLCLAGSLSAQVVVPITADSLPPNMAENNTDAAPTKQDGRSSVQVRFHHVEWPNVTFTPPHGVWDWSKSARMAVDVYNPEDKPVTVAIRVDDSGADGIRNWSSAEVSAKPKKWTTLTIPLSSSRTPFWGMRGTPDGGMVRRIDLSKVTAFQVYLPKPEREHTLVLSGFRLLGEAPKIALPFVDRFGQYKHAKWPGKLTSEKDLIIRRDRESLSPLITWGDKYGGWDGGPKLEATGWFRTEKVDGRWWLVTPEGRLFFSTGVDCVYTWGPTFTEKREPWFEWLPAEDSVFKPALGYTPGSLKMAETIGGKGRTISFYKANLIRKYGDGWEEAWKKRSYERLRAWGFNTLGNWTEPKLLKDSPLPFVATVYSSRQSRLIEGGGGYWSKMKDVFDPQFAAQTDESIAKDVRAFASNRFCIGYFVDNELAWDAVERGPLASPPDQPCRVEMVRQLKAKYSTLEALNKAWGASAESWDSLRAPDEPNEACRKDLDAWVYSFARRYFEVVKAALRRHAPHQLYLGCRFAWSHPQAIRACADVADVVSFNIYRRDINCDDWTGRNDLGKPLMIGEFHFGALDHGMFHAGLVYTANQKERAAAFKSYVREVAECPSFVGCHWFAYVDQPLTGRVIDGENYNIGMVDVTDTPYPELTAAAREINARVYRLHAESGTR